MTEWQGRRREPVTEERLVRAVDVLAEIVKEHGPAYGPLYDSLLQELTEFRQRHHESGASTEPQEHAARPRKVA